jgi:uncharacterized peroxidase-related enzyme
MPRIEPVQPAQAPGKTRQLFEGVQNALGMVPNMMKTMGQSPAVLAAYLGFNQALSGTLDAGLREQIALAVAGANRCDYCASAHTLLGANAGVEPDELSRNLRGQSVDAKVYAAIQFAQAVVAQRGRVTDADLEVVRSAGYDQAQVVEIVALVALNTFTNYFNHVAETEIDFPVVDTSVAAAA